MVELLTLQNTISGCVCFFNVTQKVCARRVPEKKGCCVPCELKRKPSISGRIFDYTRQTSPYIWFIHIDVHNVVVLPYAVVLIVSANNMFFDFYILFFLFFARRTAPIFLFIVALLFFFFIAFEFINRHS